MAEKACRLSAACAVEFLDRTAVLPHAVATEAGVQMGRTDQRAFRMFVDDACERLQRLGIVPRAEADRREIHQRFRRTRAGLVVGELGIDSAAFSCCLRSSYERARPNFESSASRLLGNSASAFWNKSRAAAGCFKRSLVSAK